MYIRDNRTFVPSNLVGKSRVGRGTKSMVGRVTGNRIFILLVTFTLVHSSVYSWSCSSACAFISGLILWRLMYDDSMLKMVASICSDEGHVLKSVSLEQSTVSSRSKTLWRPKQCLSWPHLKVVPTLYIYQSIYWSCVAIVASLIAGVPDFSKKIFLRLIPSFSWWKWCHTTDCFIDDQPIFTRADDVRVNSCVNERDVQNGHTCEDMNSNIWCWVFMFFWSITIILFYMNKKHL